MLSIIITSLNEDSRILNQTVKSIISSAVGFNIEIIVIDDASDIPVEIDLTNLDSGKIVLERNPFRLGVAQSRHIGVTLAKYDWVLMTDAHMIFHENWLSNFAAHVVTAKEETVYNGTCLGLWSNSFQYQDIDLDKLPHYYGARLSLYEPNEQQILEGKWSSEKNTEKKYNISCLMGAMYFIKKSFFFKIRGLSDLKMWGSDEPCLSLKTLLCGGEILQLKDVKAAHLFRPSSPYGTYMKYLIYNKIRMAKTLLPEKLGESLIVKLKPGTDFDAALHMINNEQKIIQEYQEYYRSIFTKDIFSLCGELHIDIPA